MIQDYYYSFGIIIAIIQFCLFAYDLCIDHQDYDIERDEFYVYFGFNMALDWDTFVISFFVLRVSFNFLVFGCGFYFFG